jgi:ribosomal protein L16 Arg81 hydroxylase
MGFRNKLILTTILVIAIVFESYSFQFNSALSLTNRLSRLFLNYAINSGLSPVADEIAAWNMSFAKEIFLTKYWQKKPLFVRGAFPNINELLPISGKDILSLSFDDDVESRIVYKNKHSKREKEYGPFEESFVDSLLNNRSSPHKATSSFSQWSILVQEVDRHIPAIAGKMINTFMHLLLIVDCLIIADIWQKYFDFIPSWRRDDVMMSYAIPEAGIGAHVDNYDVFLIQVKPHFNRPKNDFFKKCS